MPTALRLNVGSGQRRFDNSKGWVNVDCMVREPDQVPDVVCDVGREPLPYEDRSCEYVVLHHVLEHFGCGEADGLVKECYRVLQLGGSLLVFVPSMKEVARRFVSGEFSEFIFMVNTYGAYQGAESDRHKWGYSQEGLITYLSGVTHARIVDKFDWRPIEGADIARDDRWIAGAEVVK